MVDTSRINNTLGKMGYYLAQYNSVCVSVSGGSDSDLIVHIIATYFREFLPKIHFVFSNTGLEWNATKRHLDDLEQRYSIEIDRIWGRSIVLVVREKGVPILSKYHSECIEAYCRDVPWAVRKIDHPRPKVEGGYVFRPKYQLLAKAIKERGVKVSDQCCDYCKKLPLHQYQRSIGCDLAITGERKVEGGKRAIAHKSCFESATEKHGAKYMPLFFWDDETKAWYKEHEGITYSDCYEVYGMKRTGCVGCPFNSKVHDDLLRLQKYEPNLYKAAMNVFGQSYALMDEFNIRKTKILEGLEV